MMNQALILIVNCLFIINIEAVSLPMKCDLGDSDCVTKSAQAYVQTFAAGIPEIGVEKSDPMFLKHVDASSSILKLILNNVTITGLKNSQVKKIKFDQSKTSMTLTLLCSVQFEGNYEMSGNLLFLSLNGKGPLHVKLRKMEIVFHANVKEVTDKDGKTHWHYEHTGHTYQLKDKSDVEFENLFSENAILAAAAKEVIAQSGNEIILEVGPKAIDAVATEIFTNFNSLFAGISLNDLRN